MKESERYQIPFSFLISSLSLFLHSLSLLFLLVWSLSVSLLILLSILVVQKIEHEDR